MSGTSGEKRARMIKAAVIAAFLLVLGVFYIFMFNVSDTGLDCVIRRFTGYRCPGCGMTHAVSDILSLDPKAAFMDNALFLPILLYIALVIFNMFRTYINKGHAEIGSGSQTFDWIFLILILVWWPLRNIIGI